MAWNPPRGSAPDYTLNATAHPWTTVSEVTKAHRWFIERLLAMEPGTQLGGAHVNKPGYHGTRNEQAANDYSVRMAIDQQGPANKSAGTDWTHPDAHTGDYESMVKYGKRIRASYEDRNDPRLNGWREALGQFDADAPPEAIDFRGRYERVPDDTHRWHWHFSETRAYVENFDNKWKFLTVLLGWTTAEWRQSTLEDDVSAQDVIDALNSQAGKDALWAAIAGRDVIQAFDGNGVELPEKPDDPAANNITAATVLTREGRLATMLTPQRVLALVANTAQIPALIDAVKKLAGGDDVDEQALAEALAGPLVAAITAQLPEGATLTKADVEDAVRTVLRTGTGGTTAPAA